MARIADLLPPDQLAKLQLFGVDLRLKRLQAMRVEQFNRQAFIVYPSFNPNYTTK